MKQWASTLILTAIFGMVAKVMLPRGEKSPLFGPIKLLVSLILIVVMFSPVYSLLQGKIQANFFSESVADEKALDPENLLLERVAKIMSEEVQKAFPHTTFSLEIYTDNNGVPTEIQVVCDPPDEGPRIADFLKAKYKIPSIAKEKE